MVNKKYTLLLALMLMLGVSSYAQTSSSWDWRDSSVVPAGSIAQYHEFMQNKTPFPTKPRNAWEFSFGAGYSSVTGDSKSSQGLGWSGTFRKAIGNTISYRLGYFGSYNVGKGATYTYGVGPWAPIANNLTSYKTPDYKNISHNFSIELLASLNTFSNYRGDPTSNLYVLGGVGFTISSTADKDAAGKYHSIYPPEKYYNLHFSDNYVFTTFSLGAGYAYKINKKFNIAIEERLTSPVKKVNYVTGYNANTGTKNMYYSTLIKLNFNLMK